MTRRITRRRALQAGALGYFFAADAASARRAYGANMKVRVAGIGIGGKGSSDIDQAAKFMDVVALCDIDMQRLNLKGEAFPGAKKFADYRELLATMDKQIDAVTVSTADHSHAPAAVMAMRAGKHVYVQKPLTHTVFEARLMRHVAAEHKVCTQMGNQGSALNGLRRAVELIHGGTLGPVREAHVWTNRPAHYWKQSPDIVARPKEAPVPKHVNWDLFIGPAAMRPFAMTSATRAAYHPHDWRGYWDFGTGALGDMACHTANMAFRALKLDAPTAVVAEAGEINAETFPAWGHIRYIFPARGPLPACTLHWYEGKKDGKLVLPPDELLSKLLKKGEKLSDSGSILVGDKAILFSPNDYGAKFRLHPLGDVDLSGVQTTKPEKVPAGVDGDNDLHMKKEWYDAIVAGKPALASSQFDYAARLTETMLLGNIAVRFAGTKLEWDAEKLRFTNSEKATKLVSKEYRKGWDWLTKR